MIRKLFNIIIASELYNQYLEADTLSLDDDKNFIIDLLNDYILNNKLVHHIFEEKVFIGLMTCHSSQLLFLIILKMILVCLLLVLLKIFLIKSLL